MNLPPHPSFFPRWVSPLLQLNISALWAFPLSCFLFFSFFFFLSFLCPFWLYFWYGMATLHCFGHFHRVVGAVLSAFWKAGPCTPNDMRLQPRFALWAALSSLVWSTQHTACKTIARGLAPRERDSKTLMSCLSDKAISNRKCLVRYLWHGHDRKSMVAGLFEILLPRIRHQFGLK